MSAAMLLIMGALLIWLQASGRLALIITAIRGGA